MSRSAIQVVACAILSLCMLGCAPRKPPLAETPPPTVSVAKPITNKKVRDYQEFLATLDASETIEVRSRVTGYLKEIKFRPGQEVKKNETELFIIDRKPFEAALKKAEGDVKVAKADRKLALSDRGRVERLLNSKPPAATVEDREKAFAQVEVAEAKLEAFEAVREQAEINLGYTTIKADVDGVIGRNLITPGNIVNADMTLLTMIIKPDPIYAYFDVDQRTVERYRRLHDEKKGDPNQGADIDLELGLEEDGSSFPYVGKADFASPQTNPATGAKQVRGIFYQKDLKKDSKPPAKDLIPLQPGFTARVRAAVSPEFTPILVPDRAIGTDQNQKFVYVVNAENKVEYRKVTLGGPYPDNLRAITDGLKGDEWIIVNGLQRVRQGGKVDPQQVDPITEIPLKK
jgi:multidrug efflux system membrane fusion protein